MKFPNTDKFICTALVILCQTVANAQTASLTWEAFRPSNTGVPGGNHLIVEYDPQGRLWYGAVWPVFTRGGVAFLDSTDRWQTFAAWQTPLPSPLITDIEFSDAGVAWIGTENGIARYDGIGWHVFDETNTPMTTSLVNDLSVAPNGDVWVALTACCGVNGGGIAHFDQALWQWTFITGSALPWPNPFLNSVESILADSKGNVWVSGGGANEIAQFNGTSWIVHPGEFKGRLYEAPNGTIWSIGLNTISWYDGSTWNSMLTSAIPLQIGSFDISAAYVDSTNTVWISTFNGDLVSWDGTTWTYHVQILGTFAVDFAESPQGEFIVLTPFNSYKLTPQGLEGFHNAYNSGLTYHFVDGITATPNGDVWFVGASGFGQPPTGLSRLYDNGRWQSFNNSNNGFAPWPFDLTTGTNPSVNDVTHDDVGNIWIATHAGGASWDGTSWRTYTMQNSGIWDNHCEHVAVDTRGWIWFGHGQTGVSRFDGTNWEVFQVFNTPMNSNQIECVEADRFGNVWIGTSGNLVKFDGTNFTAFDPSNSGLPIGWTNDVKVAPNGDVWVATAAGVARFDGTNWETFTEANSGIPAGFCSSIAIRDNGDVWIGGFNTATSAIYGGVSSFDGTTWTPYLFGSSPISHQQVSSLAFDARGDLWIGHEAGEGVNRVSFDSCYADCDQSTSAGVLDIFDFLCFQNSFVSGAAYACDCDTSTGTGVCDVFDFLCFQNAFVAGCP
jgi:ligand-binding sensor domain-containing protein